MNKNVKGVISCPKDQNPDDEHDVCVQVWDVRDTRNHIQLSEKKVQNVQLPYDYSIDYKIGAGEEDELFGFEIQVRIVTDGELSHMNIQKIPLIVDSKLRDVINIEVKCIRSK
jgi:hypothetical protein